MKLVTILTRTWTWVCWLQPWWSVFINTSEISWLRQSLDKNMLRLLNLKMFLFSEKSYSPECVKVLVMGKIKLYSLSYISALSFLKTKNKTSISSQLFIMAKSVFICYLLSSDKTLPHWMLGIRITNYIILLTLVHYTPASLVLAVS